MKYLLVGIVFLVSNIYAQSDDKSEEILKKISTEIKGLNSFYLEFNIHNKNAATGEDSNQAGKGYVKGNKYYASFGETILISNGIKNWTVLKDEKTTYQSDASDEDNNSLTPKKIMTIWDEGFKSKYIEKTSLNQKSLHKIDLYPTNPGEVNFHTITLFVSVENNELYRVIMKTKDGGELTYTINKFEKNKAVDDSKFVYNLRNYPGYQLVRD